MGALLDQLGNYVVPQIGRVDDQAALAAAPTPPGTPLPSAGQPPDLYDPSSWLMKPDGSDRTAPYPSDLAAQAASAPPPATAPNPGQAAAPAPAPTGTRAPASTEVAPSGPQGPRDLSDVAGFMGQQGTALNQSEESASAAAVMKNQAARAQAAREGKAYLDTADLYNAANEEYSKALDQAHRAAAAENAQWMQQMDALGKQEPNNHHWFESKSTLGKGLFMLSMLTGAKAEALSPRVTASIFGDINKMMDDDVKAQEQRIARQVDIGKQRGVIMQREQQQILTDLQDRFSKKVMKIEALKNAFLAQAKAPSSTDDKAAVAAVVAELDKQRVNIAGERMKESVTMREGVLNRQKDITVANIKEAGDNARLGATLKKDYDLAALSASQKETPEEKKMVDQQGLADNATLIGPDGKARGDGVVLIHKDKKPEASQLSAAASARYAALVRVRDAIKNDTFSDLVLKKDPQMTSDVVMLGYTGARTLDPSGRITDKDFEAAVENQLGGDLSTLRGRAAQVGKGGFDKLVPFLDKEIADLPKRTGKALEDYVDYSLPQNKGAHVIWHPKDLEAAPPREPGAAETLANAGVPADQVPKTPEPVSRTQFENERALNALPPYKREGTGSFVDQAKASFDGLDPASIRKAGEARMKSVEGDSRALHEIDEARATAEKHAEANARALKDYLEHQVEIGKLDRGARAALGKTDNSWTHDGTTIREHVKEVAEKDYGFGHADPAFLERVAQDVEKYLNKKD